MILNKYSKLAAIAAVLTSVATPSHADWAQSVYPNYMPARPSNNQTQTQNPPAFTWSQYPGAPSKYVVEIRQGADVNTAKLVGTYETSRNFFLPSTTLPVGNYFWRVTPAGMLATGKPVVTAQSDWRPFTIDSNSVSFIVPDNTAIVNAITNRARPRQLPPSFTPEKGWSAAMRADRSAALTTLKAEVSGRISSLPPIAEAQWPLRTIAGTTITPAKVAQDTNVREQIGLATRQLESAALLYLLTADQTFLNEALLRGDQLTKLDVNGATSYANQDQATRQITLSIIKAFDYLRADIDRLDAKNGTTRRKTWLNTVKARMVDINADLTRDNFRLDQAPFDSHGSTLLQYASLISVLSLGEPELPEAKDWFAAAFRAFVNSVSVWAGPEGGYADGTAYGQYSVDMNLQLWQPLSQATGVNLFKKPWAIGLSRFFMHFQPPGAPGHVFGDEHDVLTQPTLMKAFASRFATAEAAWYVNRLSGSVENPLTLLQSEYPLPVASAPPAKAPPNAALYPSIGWVAMHSDMNDMNRTSIYFKSSPYGTYNHSHPDQNSILIDSGGKRLLTEAGYSDYFNSPLAQSWFRTTKAKNAITFDTGIGQLSGAESWQSLLYNGKVTQFSTSSTRDTAEGDASPAYGPAISSAVRKLWYLRDVNMLVVMDKLKAPAAHKFEWNMHSAYTTASETKKLSSFQQDLTGLKVVINNEGRTLCINSLSPDVILAPRVGAKPKDGITENHVAFIKKTAATSDEFIVLLSVGCRDVKASIVSTGGDRNLILVDSNGKQITTPVALGKP